MAKEKFILLSLDDPKTKKLAQTISNESCKKILSYIADKEGTESDIAKQLSLPLSTVHYNLKQLVKAGLVIADEYHYSKKGKEILHYKAANKYVVIAPKGVWGLKEKLKGILPVALLIGAGATSLQYFTTAQSFISEEPMKAAGMMADSVAEVAMPAAMVMEESTDMAAPELVRTTVEALPQIAETTQQVSTFWQEPFVWFTIGATVAVLFYLLIDYIKFHKEK
jgi:DNA-binding transcriptional ArsR family regulator